MVNVLKELSDVAFQNPADFGVVSTYFLPKRFKPV